ncbi:MAG: hypothetical protein K2Q22_15220 [Cytophagales bacterium]|nr:hypothetical protein [Cytophagales bacterium]
MTTANLKNKIIEQVRSIEDENLLKALDLLTKKKSEESVYILSENQSKRISESRKEWSTGNAISHENIVSELNQWLDSK